MSDPRSDALVFFGDGDYQDPVDQRVSPAGGWYNPVLTG
jgi:hypothetical protein